MESRCWGARCNAAGGQAVMSTCTHTHIHHQTCRHQPLERSGSSKQGYIMRLGTGLGTVYTRQVYVIGKVMMGDINPQMSWTAAGLLSEYVREIYKDLRI